MAPSPPAVTDGSKTWAPSHLFLSSDEDTALTSGTWDRIHTHLRANEFRAAVAAAFELPPGDNFTYHATASVNLAQAEAAIRAGRANGLHAWYVESTAATDSTEGSHVGDGEGNDGDNDLESRIPGQPSLRISGYPPATDIQAYIAVFDPTKSPANSLKSLAANAKRGSLRATVAEHLLSKRNLDPSITVPKFKPIPVAAVATASATQQQQQQGEEQAGSTNQPPPSSSRKTHHENPALDFWAYSCMALEYAGPNTNTARVKTSHHILPVYMHHFGCVCPSWEALQVIAKLASPISSSSGGGRGGGSVLDMGSGNGYWTLMLRRLGLDVVAVDSGQSRWRSVWIPDTHVADGVQYLRKRAGCPESLLLLVYPIVGTGAGTGGGEFTRKVLDAYTGDVICVAGTQNGNGYTGFRDMMVDEYMAREKPRWEKVAQVALPSFAGKDDALFAFLRRKEG